MSEFRMPSLGADMEAGTLIEWMKQPGDHVQRGDAIAAVETQKGAIEIEVFEAGVLEKVFVPVGQRVPVGTVLAFIRVDKDSGNVVTTSSGTLSDVSIVVPTKPTGLLVSPTPSMSIQGPASEAKVTSKSMAKISPAASRRALELGLELSTLLPAADGVIGLSEVNAAQALRMKANAHSSALQASSPSRQGVRNGIDVDEMRKAIAAAMVRSWHEIPHYFVSSTLDVSPMLTWLQSENTRRPLPDRLHYAVILVRAMALALKGAPVLNGRYTERGFEPSEQIHLGIAIAMRGGGLIAPAILDADKLEVNVLMARLNDLIARVRSGRLRSTELTDATATLTNLGEETADAVQPIIYPPQVAIIGCGQIIERPWAKDLTTSVRRTLTVTIGGDHRVSNGRSAAKFLQRLDDLLQHPERL